MKEQGLAKHLIVVSYDAFSEDNWEVASKLPNMSRLLNNGSYTTKLKSVYPTLTYVVHSTMVTGVYSEKHGVIHNNPLQPFVEEDEQNWFWFRKDLKVPTIYEATKKSKLTTASLLWPVTGKASIRYNIPEIRAIGNENQSLKILKNGSPFFTIGMERKYGHIRNGITQPYLDDFTTRCAVDTIKRKKPNLLLMHLIDLDDAKHNYGTKSTEVEQVLIRMDQRLGELIKAVEEAGILNDTVFLILGDHGQIDVKYKVRLNTLLREKGLIYEKDGQYKWRAYTQSTGGSAYLFVKEGDEEAQKLAVEILKQALQEDSYGIEAVYSREQLNDYHIDSQIQYMVEAKVGYSFDDSLNGPVTRELEKEGITYATHGYSPDKPNYRCNLIVSGDCIKNEVLLGDVAMVDIAPTMAKILGIKFDHGDGRALVEILP